MNDQNTLLNIRENLLATIHGLRETHSAKSGRLALAIELLEAAERELDAALNEVSTACVRAYELRAELGAAGEEGRA